MLMRSLGCLALLIGLAACSTSPGRDTPDTQEQLLVRPPEEWKQVYQFNNVETRLAEFIPPDESDTDWNSKLSFESHKRLAAADPISILTAEVVRLKELCNFVQHFNIFSGYENNYPTSAWLIMCGRHSLLEKGEVDLVKVIQGNDYLYIVRITRRIEPFAVNEAKLDQREVAAWSDYLKRISLCNDTSPEHACPQEESPP